MSCLRWRAALSIFVNASSLLAGSAEELAEILRHRGRAPGLGIEDAGRELAFGVDARRTAEEERVLDLRCPDLGHLEVDLDLVVEAQRVAVAHLDRGPRRQAVDLGAAQRGEE